MNTRRSTRNKKTPPKRKHETETDSESSDSYDTSVITVIPKKNINKQKEISPKRKHESEDDDINNDDNNDNDGSSSDSSVGDYLKNPDEIDLSSSFFTSSASNINEKPPDFNTIEKKIFGGVQHLSDDSEESDNSPQSEPENDVCDETITQEQTAPVEKINFTQLREYNKKIEEAKACVEKYEKSKKVGTKKTSVNNQEITKLLKLGETKNEPHTSFNSLESDFDDSDDENEMDWQEIEETDDKKEDKINIPKEGVQITVALPQNIRQKSKGVDMMTAIKRRINRVKKENQVYVHKVHLLCWIAHGNCINSILNDTELLAPALSLLPSDKCYPPKHADMSYLEQIVKWYGKMIKILPKKQDISVKESLEKAISSKTACCNRDFILIFIIILRSLGLQCRLILSLQCLPLRPPNSELCSLSTKETESNKKSENKPSTSKTENKPSTSKASNKTSSKDKPSKSTTKPANPLNKSINSSKDKKSETKKVERKKTETQKAERKKTETEKVERKKHETELKNHEIERKKPETEKAERKKPETNKPERKKPSDKPKTQEKKSARLSSRNSTNQLKISQVDGADDEEPTKEKRKPSLRIKLKRNLNDSTSSTSELSTLNNKNKKLLDVEDEDFKPKRRSPNSKSPKDINGNKKSNIEKTKSPRPTNKSSASTSELSKIKSEKTPTKSPKPSTSVPNNSPAKKLSEKLQLNKVKIEKTSPKSSPSSSNYFNGKKPKHDVTNDIVNLIKGEMSQKRIAEQRLQVKSKIKKENPDYDSDYFPDEDEPIEKPVKKRKSNTYCSEDEFKFKVNTNVKRKMKTQKEIDSRVVSSDDESTNQDSGKKKKIGNDIWVEVFLEEEEKWISVDLIKGQIHCVSELYSRASQPVSYILAWNNDLSLKDVTARYCPNWNTVTRKLRVDSVWWKNTLQPFLGVKNARDKEEDEDLARQELDKPLPTTISEYKNHPLYALKRHLLKFEAIYPPNAVTLGFIRNEPVYARECVHTLHSREIWVKHAKVVKPAQEPYKIVKARPKYDKLTGNMITDLPLEIFGSWQVEDYVPPTAENGIVPRNAFGNVELFKACMLPKKTVHLQLPGLNKICRKLRIDCAPAVVGFDFHSGFSHPMFDGYVVCEEFKDTLIEAWEQDQIETAKKEQEKYDKRVWGNWRKLIKAVLIRERLKARYDFGTVETTSSSSSKGKGKKSVFKKLKTCKKSDDEWTDVE